MAYTGEPQTNIENADHGARVSGQSIYECKEKPCCRVGTRLVLGDRVFRYSKAGAALSAAYVVQMEVPEATYAADQEIGTHGVGVKIVEFTVNSSGTEFTLDQYAEGYFLVDDAGSVATEEGYMYKIKSNTAAAVNTTCYLTLYDALANAISASATGAVMRNPYMDVIKDAQTACPIGISPIEVTDNYYFWLQTWGPSAIVNDGTGVSIAHRCTNTAGEADDLDAQTEPSIGIMMTTGDANDMSIIQLRCSP